MITVTVPPELAGPLVAEAGRRGVTPEALALEGVRSVIPAKEPTSLLEFLGDSVGAFAGSSEPFSQDCGKRFADGLASGQPARP